MLVIVCVWPKTGTTLLKKFHFTTGHVGVLERDTVLKCIFK